MDDRMLVDGGTGVATYARALRQAQRAMDPDAQLLSAGPPPGLARLGTRYLSAFFGKKQSARVVGSNFLCRDIYEISHAYFAIHKRMMPIRAPGRAGVMHWSYPLAARLVGWVNLYTVHDLIPINQPELTSIRAAKHRRLLGLIARSGGGIVTVSEASRRELAALAETADVPTWNCSQPVDIAALEPAATTLPAGLVAGKYFLVCGTVEPRKNLARVVRAYKASKTDLPLVIAGPDGWKAETLTPLFDAQDGIVRLPYQERSTLLGLIQNARALVFVSLAEGFGLPVIEAMGLGTPVLTSQVGGLAEVAGDAAHKVDPYDEGAIASAFQRLARDDLYCQALAAKGRVRATAFTYDRFTRKLAQAYEQAADLQAGAPAPAMANYEWNTI